MDFSEDLLHGARRIKVTLVHHHFNDACHEVFQRPQLLRQVVLDPALDGDIPTCHGLRGEQLHEHEAEVAQVLTSQIFQRILRGILWQQVY